MSRPLPILIEKILAQRENQPASWAVDGTTGYDFLGAMRGLFVDPSAERALSDIHRNFSRDFRTFADHVRDAKEYILRFTLASEVQMLAGELERIAGHSRKWSDFTMMALTRALTEVIAAFPVYRTYVSERDGTASDEDRRHVQTAIAGAAKSDTSIAPDVLRFIEDILLMRADAGHLDGSACRAFAARFQQITGPAMAKAIEDTAFYRYTRLICRNDVGCDPSRFAVSPEELHAQNAERARCWPLAMTSTSTHDKKRGEDAAMRIAAISEVPAVWRRALGSWSHVAQTFKTVVREELAPCPSDEYAFYQTVLGAWPFGWDGCSGRIAFTARLLAATMKAVKEAKSNTSWTNANAEYDAAVEAFVSTALSNDGFMAEMRRFADRTEKTSAVHALSQTLVKMCAPGIPDTYQGSERWNQSLVDPDNRGPVDYRPSFAAFGRMREATGDLGAFARDLLDELPSAAAKMWVTHRALLARRAHRELFLRGTYDALDGERLFAFSRTFGDEQLIALAPRLVDPLTADGTRFPVGDAWGSARVEAPRGRYRDVLTDRMLDVTTHVALAEAFTHLPGALLIREK